MTKIDFAKIDEMIRSGEMARRREARLKKVVEYLKEIGISSTIIDKEDWGTVVLFEYKEHKIISDGIKKSGKLSMYYYSEEYGCKSCYLHI